MELHVFVQLWNRVSAPKLNEANTIPAIENGECCVREHTLLIRCRCSVCYCHRKLLPFDSSTYISEGKTSKRQRRKYMIPNRRPSFTSNVSIGYSMWPFCFLRIACSMFESVAYTTWLARLATKKRSIRFTVGKIYQSTEWNNHESNIFRVHARILRGFCMTFRFFVL